MAVFLSLFFMLFLAYAVLIDYYRRSWDEIPEFVPGEHAPNTKISVIIPMRNEQKNIPDLFASLCEQKYPTHLFEVIVIDDHSTDNTWPLINSCSEQPISVRPIRLADLAGSEAIRAHKKLAIEQGVELAQGELIVTTDADCIFHPQWLSTIAEFYEVKKAKFIAAPVKIKTTGRFLSVFQALDFLTLQGITGASVHKRFHTMCNGANLAYEKKSFLEVGGFKEIDRIPSGDDMFLMYKIFKKYPQDVHYLKARQAIVMTQAVNSWKEFFHQRIRWASKATHYDDKKLFWILLLVYCLNLSFLVFGVASFWNIRWLLFLVIVLMAKIVVELPFISTITRFYREEKVAKYFMFMQPFHIVYTIIAGWLGKFGTYEWKGRRIKS